MPRIFKGSESTLRLLISKTGDYQALTEIKIKLYTTDIENAIEIIDGIQVCKNIAIITLAPRAFMGMEDGLINYIIDGATEDDVFHTERQSNYMLKSLSYINEDGVASQTMTIESNGEYRVTPNDGLYVDINVNVPDLNGSYDDGFNVGYGQGKTDGANEQKSKLESINITENGTYTKEDGYNQIEVNVPDLNGSYNEGYAQGKTDGVNEQKGKLETISITENGTYSKEDGYNHIEVNVPDLNGSYEQGKTDGVNEQKSKLESISITENGTYTKEDGYNQIEVNVPDLNGSYNEGYAQGKTDGVNEQKGKLETISITENGTYSKEDGYNEIVVEVPDLNGSYDEGYNQGQADIAANARVLNVTENGVYKSKFSDSIIPTITGVYADGTNFYNYAELNDKVFNTKIIATVDNRLEFWYKGDNTLLSNPTYNLIIGAGFTNKSKDCFQVRYNRANICLYANIGNSTKTVENWDNTVWHHLIVSKAEGLWIDGEKKGDFSPTNTIKGEFFINGVKYDVDGSRTANGCFGMIKIDDVVIIPTADGFLNTNKGELLEVVKDGSYTFTENLPTYAEGELYKTINVNVPDLNGSYDEGKTDGVNEQKSKLETINITQNGTYTKEDGYNQIEVNVNAVPKINVKEAGLKFGNSAFKEVPEWADFEGITDMSYMFGDCYSLQTVPQIDTSNVTDMGGMFYSCRNLQTIHQIDTSNVTNMNRMFNDCSRLETIPEIDTSNVVDMMHMFDACDYLQTIPLLNTSKVTDMSYMFAECFNLQTIPSIDTSNVISMGNMFYSCRSLVSLPALNAQSLNMPSYYSIFSSFELPKLTDFGGFLNLKCSLTNAGNLKKLPNLTYESCINVLNGLYDFTGNGETPNSSQGQLKVHQNFLDKVGDEISIGTNKGWQITV